MLYVAAAFAALGSLLALALAHQMLWGKISGAEARQRVEAGALLLDVRSPAEFAAGHPPQALNIPFPDLVRRIREIGPRERPIVVYCAVGVRSAAAKRRLTRLGYTVADLGWVRRWPA